MLYMAKDKVCFKKYFLKSYKNKLDRCLGHLGLHAKYFYSSNWIPCHSENCRQSDRGYFWWRLWGLRDSKNLWLFSGSCLLLGKTIGYCPILRPWNRLTFCGWLVWQPQHDLLHTIEYWTKSSICVGKSLTITWKIVVGWMCNSIFGVLMATLCVM